MLLEASVLFHDADGMLMSAASLKLHGVMPTCIGAEVNLAVMTSLDIMLLRSGTSKAYHFSMYCIPANKAHQNAVLYSIRGTYTF